MGDWVIIVDNDEKNLAAAEKILSEAGKQVTVLTTGNQLLEYIRSSHMPDLILINVDLPGIDGFDTLRILKKELVPGQEIPVIFMTDENDHHLESKGLESGAMDFITKPFLPEVLLSRVQKVLDIEKRLLKYERDAEMDPLTGFLNKTTAAAQIACLCTEKSGLLCTIDLDDFKAINDLYGHDIGDRALIMFSEILNENISNEAVIGRIGGDEFIAFIPDMHTSEELTELTEKINSEYIANADSLLGSSTKIPIGISIGAVAVPEYGTDYNKLFQLADQALYFVKQNGKHGCRLYKPQDLYRRGQHQYLDLETVTAILEERNASPNAMWMGNEVFGSIYRYMVRYMDRYHAMAYRVLFTVKTPETITDIENSELMIQFRKMMQTSLQASDVMMECGENQLFLLMPEIQEYDIDQVINRLLRNWNNSEYAKSSKVSYEAGPVQSRRHPKPEVHDEQNVWIAIVDDDPINLEIAANILREQNMFVSTLHSGQELIDLVKEHRPDLVLLDLYMPEMDGFETLRQLRRQADHDNDIPVIFLTGDEDYETEVRCLKLGAMDFIKKPFVPEVLNIRVSHIIELTRLQRNLAATVHRKTQENQNLSMHVVHSLTEAIDAKDKYTNSHSEHVAEYAKEISRRFGYTETQQDEIYMMGLLHDIGKIGIPDAVINKPGKLTDEEYKIIKRHPEVGSRILQTIEEMPRLYMGARWHHERFDGRGYPDGLAGEDIPEEARIIAVADAYDAMASKRSYRDALPQSVVREEIVRGAGTQFDPQFAAIMIEMIDEDKDYQMK